MKLSKAVMLGAAIGLAAVSGGLVLGVAGCSSTPVVDYAEGHGAIATPRSLNETQGQYALWTTALHFKKEPGGEMTVIAATAEDPARTHVLVIAGQDHWYKTTAVNLVTAPDSDVLTTVNVTVTDHLASTITTVSELAGTLIPLAVGSSPSDCFRPDPVPAVAADAAFDEELNVFSFLRRLDGSQGCEELSSGSVPARQVKFAEDGVSAVAVLSVDAPPSSALRLDDRNAKEVFAAAKNVFLFPACRNATLQYRSTLSKPGAKPQLVVHTMHFRFSDPRYVQSIALPVKGSLSVKPQCGMTLVSDAGDAGTSAEIAKAMADAVQSVAGAVKQKP